MHLPCLVLSLGLWSSVATAAPVEMAYSGRILDTLGVPAQGVTDVTVSLYRDSDGGTAFWTQTFSPDAQAGFFTVVLGVDANDVVLDSNMFNDAVFVGLAIGIGDELIPRSPLLSVPHAAHAVSADTALEATTALTADSAQSAEFAATGQSLVSPNWGRLIVDRSVNNDSMPVEWTPTYLGNNVGRTWIWSADGPNFRDPVDCQPIIQVYDQETTWKGQYIVTVESSTRLNVQWSGWYLRVNNAASAVIDQGNGMVTATLSNENGIWRVQHMSGIARVTPFECH